VCAVWCVFLSATRRRHYTFRGREKKSKLNDKKKMRFPKSHATAGPWRSSSSRRQQRENTRTYGYMLCARRGGAIDRAAAATSGKSRISHAKRKVFGRKTTPPGPARRRPTTFPFCKTTTIIIRVHPSRVFSSLHGSRVIHHLRVVVVDVLVIIIIHRGVTCLKYSIPGDSFIKERQLFQKPITFFKKKKNNDVSL